MNSYQALIDHFGRHRPLINIIMDGYGLGKEDNTNAIYRASTPFVDYLRSNYANTTLFSHGRFVGLPGEKDLGGSEVGHLTIGAGRIIAQGPTLIVEAIKDGSFFEKPVLQTALENAQIGALHLIGLLSDGNVHSHISHFETVIAEAGRQGVEKCHVHALLDGRDVGIQTADVYVDRLEKAFKDVTDAHPDWEYNFASGGGREVITMDRDKNWKKVEAGWNTHVLGESGSYFDSVQDAVQHFREQSLGLIDQDCPPFNIRNKKGEIPKIMDGDSVVFMNFRADRAVELTRAFVEENFRGFRIDHRPDIYFASMMIYDEDSDLPKNRIMDSPVVENPFGRRILNMGLDQFRLTETQKYAHVTFFFNGGYRNPLNPIKETYHLINSDKIDSFALAPLMKSVEIADKAIEFVKSRDFDFGLINLANADMVGHTGDMKASIEAVEAVDLAVKRICDAIREVNGVAVITADHGNADEMIMVNKTTDQEEVCTKHSINPIPFIVFDPGFKGDYSLKRPTPGAELDLSMISGTNFILLGKPIPSDINDSLFEI